MRPFHCRIVGGIQARNFVALLGDLCGLSLAVPGCTHFLDVPMLDALAHAGICTAATVAQFHELSVDRLQLRHQSALSLYQRHAVPPSRATASAATIGRTQMGVLPSTNVSPFFASRMV